MKFFKCYNRNYYYYYNYHYYYYYHYHHRYYDYYGYCHSYCYDNNNYYYYHHYNNNNNNIIIMLLFFQSTEVRAAEQRALAFARRMWTDSNINKNLDLIPLLNIRIISSLAKWFFNVLSRHLISFKVSDLRGTYMLALVFSILFSNYSLLSKR